MKTKTFLPVITPARFARMGQLTKRVAIAEDVVARIDTRFIKARPGSLFHDTPSVDHWQDHPTPLKDLINQQRCEVCAKGALACSFVGNLNRYEDLEDSFGLNAGEGHEGTGELVTIFGRTLWDAIEVAFEKETFAWTDSTFSVNGSHTEDTNLTKRTPMGQLVIDSFKSHRSPTKRMRAIYANIAENRGRLKLKDGSFIG